jgi:hypothetical protein
MRALVLALLLAACASASGQGSTPGSDAADLGNGQWLITCYTFASNCTQRASLLCPAGFDTLSTQVVPTFTGLMQRNDYHMTVQCRA